MSTLKRLDYNLKGQKKSVDLSPVVLVTGPNGSGKSTLLLAVSAGLWGLAQSPTDLQRPYIGPDRIGSTELAFDTGTIRRDLSWGASGEKPTRAKVEAERIAGPHLIRWDLADFATVSDTNREKLLRGICGNIQATSLSLPDSPLKEAMFCANPRENQDAGVWLERSLKWAADRYTEFNSAQKTATEGAKAAGEAAEQAAPPGTLSAAKAELDRLQKEVATLRAQRQTAARDAEHVRATEARRQKAAEQHAQLEEEQGRLQVAMRQGLEQPGSYRQHYQDCLKVTEAAKAKMMEQNATVSALEQPVKALRGEVLGLDGQIAALEGQTGVHCAHCGAADPLAISVQLDALRAQIAAKAEEIREATEDLVFAQDVQTRRIQTHDAAVKAEFAALDTQRAGDAAWKAREEQQRRLSQIEAEMAQLATEMNEAITTAPAVFDAEAQLYGLEEQLKAAMAAHDAHLRCSERGRVHQEALVKRAKAEADFEAIKELGKALRTLQGEVAAKAWGPLQIAANDLLAAMGSPLRASFKSAADFGATDARRDGGYASFWALSDAERATVGAALALAMVRLSSAPWRGLVVDGLEKMDPDTLEGFLSGVVEAQKQGWLHNFVGALVSDEQLPEMDGVQQVWMGAA